MRIQNLAIIFLVIAIPLIMILSYYLNLQQDTLKLQAEYDTKLLEATKEGIKAFEVNTVDWSEWASKKSSQTLKSNANAVINTFTTSLANNLNLSGTAKEYMLNYIPAVALTMYDGYYIYSQSYAPVTLENSDGVQLFRDTTQAGNKITTDSSIGEILYRAEGTGDTYTYEYVNSSGASEIITIKDLTTDVTKAKREYKHTLSNQTAYSARYKRTGLNVVVNYTLDNRIYVYGTLDNESIDKDGYLVYFNNNSIIPRAYIQNYDSDKKYSEDDIIIKNKISDIKYNGIVVEEEVLEEQILYFNGTAYTLETFRYVYDIEHNKLYYDENIGNFFTITSNRERQFIEENVKVGQEVCRYKSVSILWGNNDDTTEYKKIYQLLNKGNDQGKWYISLNDEEGVDKEEVDTQIKEGLQNIGINNINIWNDCSAISYYVESYAFTNWVKQNLAGNNLKQQDIEYNKENGTYKIVEHNIENVFNIYGDNNPEDETSLFVQHKKEVMKNNIITALNLSITNYNRNGIQEFKLPVLTDMDWEQAFSNISLITFFQGVPIGLKNYNNYAISTSTTNREYVDPDEIYFVGADKNYHRVYCEKCGNIRYTGYRSVEYVLKNYTIDDTNIYYYQHDNYDDNNSETACYYCVVNRANYNSTQDENIFAIQTKVYNEALARERYYQKQQILASLFNDISVSVTKKKMSLTNTDIIFILDDSGSMEFDYESVKFACRDILNAMLESGASENFYIGFIRFDDTSERIGSITSVAQKTNLIEKIENVYGRRWWNSLFFSISRSSKNDRR